jgi:hypothetical protein
MVFCPLLNLPCEIMLCIKISDFISQGECRSMLSFIGRAEGCVRFSISGAKIVKMAK